MFFAVIQHSWYYYVAGFVAGMAMIVRGVQLMLRNREQNEQKSREAQEAEFQKIKAEVAEKRMEREAQADADAPAEGEAVTHYVRSESMPVPTHETV